VLFRSERKFSKAKSLLILDHPFFGAAVARRPVMWDDNIPTASMSANGQMKINPSFAEPLTVKQLQFLLAHEAMHFMLSHSLRRKHRDPKAWNIACDKVINDTLIDAGIGEFIEGGVTLRDARNYASEELYDENDNGGDGPGGTGNDIGDPTDDEGNALDSSQMHELEAQAKVEMLQNAKVAKMMGKLPASIERMIDELVAIHTPWHEILERYMQAKVKDDYSWSRPNRRLIGQNIYLPGQAYVPKMGEVVVVIDTSGSIGQVELNEFNAHVNRIMEMCGPERVHVMYVDSEINHVDTYEPEDFPITCTPHGGGGTDLEVAYKYIDEQGIDPECVVFLTDGYTDFTNAPRYPVVWLMTTDVLAPYGLNVPFVKEA
jgi:predicted metal-dependent peptidase